MGDSLGMRPWTATLIAVATAWLASPPAGSEAVATGAIHGKDNREIRPGKGIGPVDIGDTKAAVDNRLGKGKRDRNLSDLRHYRVAGGRLGVFFRPGRKGSLTRRSRAYIIQTKSPAFTLGSVTVATPFEEAQAALSPQGWASLDCRSSQGYAWITRSRRYGRTRRTTSFWYFSSHASIEVRSEEGSPYIDPACPPLD